MAATDFGRLTVVELRQELKRRNLSQVGKKADLVDRLTAFETDQENGANEANQADQADQADQANEETQADQTDQAASEPRDLPGGDKDKAASDSPHPLGEEESAKPDSHPAIGAQESAPEPVVAQNDVEAPATNDDLNNTTPEGREAPKGPEEPAPSQGSVDELSADKVVDGEPVPVPEIVNDTVSRKRRSRSPPPEDETSRKRARASDQTSEGDVAEPRASAQPPSDVVPSEAPPPPSPAVQSAADGEAAARETTQHSQGKEYRSESDSHRDRETTPPYQQQPQTDPSDERIAGYERDVAPAQHPATSALYIKNFMRPLREQQLRDYLTHLAALPGAAPDPDCVVDFYLDQIRTHAFVSFTSVSAASRVRTALHGSVWPNERNRKELWVDFVPEDKVADWIEREQSGGGRGSSGRWEVRYEPDDNGDIVANLVNAEMEPVRRESARQPLPPPPVPTGPARSYPGVEGAPLGPRGRGTNHYRQAPPPFGPSAADDYDYDRDRNRSHESRTTRAHPPLHYQPVPEDLAQRRLDNMNAHITKDRYRDLGRPDEINRYTFEDGDEFVDRGKEAFIGIRPPHRERERRRLGIGRGGGARGPPPPRRRTPSPRRPLRDDDGYRGGGGRDDYDRYRDRDDDYRDRRSDRYFDDVPRSRFDGQPLPTFGGGNGGRGGRRGGGGGWRDRY